MSGDASRKAVFRPLSAPRALGLALVLSAALGASFAAADKAEDLYAKANESFEKGDLAAAGRGFSDLRRRYPGHRLYWQAGTMWARCASDPKEAAERFAEVAGGAPSATKAECEMEIAHLLMMQGRFKDSAQAYGAWLKANSGNERAEEAAFWRGLSLRESGKTDDARAVLAPLRDAGRQDTWRGMAGLLLAEMAAGHDAAAAYGAYVDLSREEWAKDVRPQALLGAARMTDNAWKRKQLARALERDYPESDEVHEARKLLNAATGTGVKYGVQVGAFVNKSRALKEKERFEKKGHRVEVVRRRQVGMELYAVIVGPFDSRESAAGKKSELRKTGVEAFVTTY